MAQVDEMGSEGSGSSQEEAERSESDVRELRFGETFQERARILDVVRDKQQWKNVSKDGSCDHYESWIQVDLVLG